MFERLPIRRILRRKNVSRRQRLNSTRIRCPAKSQSEHKLELKMGDTDFL
jgi:hypothetical protein